MKRTVCILLLSVCIAWTFAQNAPRGLAPVPLEADAARGLELHFYTGRQIGDIKYVGWISDTYIISQTYEDELNLWDANGLRHICAALKGERFVIKDGSLKIARCPENPAFMSSPSDLRHSPDWRYWYVDTESDTGEYGGSVIWDTIRNTTWKLHEADDWITLAAWSSDGRQFAFFSESRSTVTVVDLYAMEEMWSFSARDVVELVFPQNTNVLAVYANDEIRCLDRQTGKELYSLSDVHHSRAVSWSPNGKTFAKIQNHLDSHGHSHSKIAVYDSMNGKFLYSGEAGEALQKIYGWSHDGHFLACAESGRIVLWDAVGKKRCGIIPAVLKLNDTLYGETEMAVSDFSDFFWFPDNRHIGAIGWFHDREGSCSTLFIADSLSGAVFATAMNYDWGMYFGYDSYSKAHRSQTEEEDYRGGISYPCCLSPSSDGSLLAAGCNDGRMLIYMPDFSGDGIAVSVRQNDAASFWQDSIRWSQDGRYFVYGHNPPSLFDAYTGERCEWETLPAKTKWQEKSPYSPDGNFFITLNGGDGRYDATELQLYTHSSGTAELAYTMVNSTVGGGFEYLTYTPEGFFTGTEWAMKNLVYIVDGLEVTGLDQLYDKLYRPDLIAAKARGEDISAEAAKVGLASLLGTGKAPLVSLGGVSPVSETRDFSFDVVVQNTGGGVGAVFVSLNGTVRKVSAGHSKGLQSLAVGESKTLRCTVSLEDGENTIEAYAKNAAGVIESLRAQASVTWHGKTARPNLYVLSVGINEYRDGSLRLNYAAPDARAVAETFRSQGSALYGNVSVSTLLDSAVTKQGLSDAFKSLASKITADDVFVFYAAGHGTVYDDADYYYLPVNFRYTGDEAVPTDGISKDDLLENLSLIKAGKTLVMLDTCNSGAFLDSAQRGLTEKTAVDKLARAIGHAVIVASSATKPALEGYNGHGIFTYILIEGLSGKADANKDGFVTLTELSLYLENEVPERSYEKWNDEQVPQKKLPAQDFPLMEVVADAHEK